LYPNPDGDMLGEQQWSWFEKALRRSKASVNVIVQGLQVHPYRYPNPSVVESWANFPRSQQRLYEALLQEGVKSPILISGDVHMAQLLRKDCFQKEDIGKSNVFPRSLIELTTSGMTHSWGTIFTGRVIAPETWEWYYVHFLGKLFMSLVHAALPMPDLAISKRKTDYLSPNDAKVKHSKKATYFESGGADGSKAGKQFSLELNFGELEFDWDDQILHIRVWGVEHNAPPLISAKWSFDQLSGHTDASSLYINATKVRKSSVNGDFTRQWYCEDHRGHVNLLHSIVGKIFVASGFIALTFGPLIIPLLVFFWILKKIRRKFKVKICTN